VTAVVTPAETLPAEVTTAWQLQRARPGWVVMWSPWRRTFTAFAYFAPVALVLDSPTAEQLTAEMRQAELQYAAPVTTRPKGTKA
jgi:hypothetical protein